MGRPCAQQPEILNRFLLKIKRQDGHWIWCGGIGSQGYGISLLYGKKNTAHRVSYLFLKGSIPEGLCIDHICRIRSCVNPAHLRLVTPMENALINSMCPTALNKAKTHCKYGHEFTEENTYNSIRAKHHPNGRRTCVICSSRNSKKYYQVRKGKLLYGRDT